MLTEELAWPSGVDDRKSDDIAQLLHTRTRCLIQAVNEEERDWSFFGCATGILATRPFFHMTAKPLCGTFLAGVVGRFGTQVLNRDRHPSGAVAR